MADQLEIISSNKDTTMSSEQQPEQSTQKKQDDLNKKDSESPQANTGAQSTSIEVGDQDGQASQQADQSNIANNMGTPGYCYGIFKRHMIYDPLAIVSAILIFIGGIIGFIMKDSTPSLVAGTVFALLILAATYYEGVRKNPYPLIVTFLALGGMMLYRYNQSGNFMPSGLVALIAFVMSARHCYLLYLRRQQIRP